MVNEANEPQAGEDLVAVFEHNGIPVTIADKEQCCGMPKLELGDLQTVTRLMAGLLIVLVTLGAVGNTAAMVMAGLLITLLVVTAVLTTLVWGMDWFLREAALLIL